MNNATSRILSRLFNLMPLLALVLLVEGCATERQLSRDATYPAGWPDIACATADSNALDGKYLNQGTIIDSKGIAQPILLTDILIANRGAEGELVQLQVLSKKKTAGKPARSRLIVHFGQQCARQRKISGCEWHKNALFAPGRQASGSSVVPFSGSTSQTTVWLTRAADGSLLAKVAESTAGLIFLIPYGTESTYWARFSRAGDG